MRASRPNRSLRHIWTLLVVAVVLAGQLRESRAVSLPVDSEALTVFFVGSPS